MKININYKALLPEKKLRPTGHPDGLRGINPPFTWLAQKITLRNSRPASVVESRVPVDCVHAVNVGKALLRQVQVKSVDVLLQLRHGCGANDSGGGAPAALAPRQGQLRPRQPVLLCDFQVRLSGHLRPGVTVPLHVAGENVKAGVGGRGTHQVLAGEGASSQGGICKQAHVPEAAGLRKVGLEWHSHCQGVTVLDTDDAGQAMLLSGLHKLRNAVGGLIGDADVPHLQGNTRRVGPVAVMAVAFAEQVRTILMASIGCHSSPRLQASIGDAEHILTARIS